MKMGCGRDAIRVTVVGEKVKIPLFINNQKEALKPRPALSAR